MAEKENAVVKVDAPKQELAPMTIQDVLGRTVLVRQVLEEVMIKDVHYGVIPGCGDKPTLLKPGSEKLCLTFRLAPEYVVEKTDLPREHREYETTCNLYSIPDHAFVGSGVATCSTMESKWRFRNKAAICPECKAETIIKGKAEYGGGWLCWKKKGGCGAKFEDKDPSIVDQDTGKTENDNPADQYNTVKKMSAKRALASATITATSASDVFAQDLDDLKANGVIAEADYTVKEEKQEAKPVADPKPKPKPEPEKKAEPANEGAKETDDYVNEILEHCTFIVNLHSEDRASRELQNASAFGENKGFDAPSRLAAVHESGKLSFKWAKRIAQNLRKTVEGMMDEGDEPGSFDE